jgi:hypothetical protein
MTAEASVDVRAAPGGLARIELTGSFGHPHWLAFLCGGLSAAGVSVVSGEAIRSAPLTWDGHLLVQRDVAALAVVALAGRRPPVRDPSAPVLTWSSAERRADGQVDLRVEAPDALGLLGRLLARTALLTLLPSEVHIATQGGVVRDRFVLSGIGSAPPSEEVLVALREMLLGMTG